MTLRNAAVLAIVGMALWAIRLAISLVTNLSGVTGGFVSLDAFMVSLVDFFAAVSLLVFFVVFYRRD